jgi:hypothetical protein
MHFARKALRGLPFRLWASASAEHFLLVSVSATPMVFLAAAGLATVAAGAVVVAAGAAGGLATGAITFGAGVVVAGAVVVCAIAEVPSANSAAVAANTIFFMVLRPLLVPLVDPAAL